MSTLSDYVKKLAVHDWYYQMSDDYSVYCRGRDASASLTLEAATDEKKRKALMLYQASYFGTLTKDERDAQINELLKESTNESSVP